MARIPGIRRFFRLPPSRREVARDVADELEFHLSAQTDELRARGLTPDEARREALRRFGDVSAARAELRAIDGGRLRHERRAEWWNAFWQDLRYAARGLRIRPAFASVVIVTLGLGVGANATMFGIVDRLLLRPPAYLSDPSHTGRIYLHRTTRSGEQRDDDRVSYARFTDLRDGTSSFAQMAAVFNAPSVIGSGDAARNARVSMVTAGFWPLFGLRPWLGRFFLPDEDQPPSGTPVAVLGYALWRDMFGADPAVIGRSLRIGSVMYTIVGVAPPGFSGAEVSSVDAWVPLTTVAAELSSARDYTTSYNQSWLQLLARRRPDVTLERANADLSAAFARSLLKAPAALPLAQSRPRAQLGSILVQRGPKADASARVSVWLAGVSFIVLLIACANVANLLLVRALGREREIAVRIALGVSRGRLLVQLLTESMLLALLGGAAGMLIANWAGGVLRRTLLPDVTWTVPIADTRTMLFASAAALLTGILSGLAPALQASRPDLVAALKHGGRDGGVHGSRLRATLLVAQAALSVVLLVGAGLFVRSLLNVRALELGYDPRHIAFVRVDPRGAPFEGPQRQLLFERMREQLAAVPGVEASGLTATVPFYLNVSLSIVVPGTDTADAPREADVNLVGGDYFAAMGIALRRGRYLDSRDIAGAAPTMVISESGARHLWPGRDPLGRCVTVGADTMPCSTVVGVVADVRGTSLREASALQVYLPAVQAPHLNRINGLLVRTAGDANSVMPVIRRTLQPIMPGNAYVTVSPFENLVAPEMRPWRLGATMFGAFGALALVLAAVGLYGVIAYDVAQRSHELGIRMALGARGADLLRLVVLQGVRLAAIGMAIGLAISLAAGHWLAPLLFNVSPNDSVTLFAVAATLLAVALLATLVPAMRAARVEPSVVLRDG